MSKNFAYSTVASPAPGASGVSLTVRTGHGSRFYVGKATVFPAGATPSPDNAEVLSVTAVDGDTLTVTRTVESSSARTIGVGDVVVQGVTATMWDDLVALVATKASASLDADGTLTVNGTTVEVATDAQLAALSGTYGLLGGDGPSLTKMPRRQVTYLADLGRAHSYTANSNTAVGTDVNDTSQFLRGTQSAKIVTKGDGTVAAVRNLALSPVSLTGKRFEVTFRVSNMDNLTAVVVYFGDTSFANFNVYTMHNFNNSNAAFAADEWVTCTFDASSITATTGTPNTGAVTCVQVGFQDRNGQPINGWVQSVAYFDAPTAYPNGVVSLTFDDGYASQWSTIRPKLDQYGYLGTFYPIVNLVGAGGYLTLAQLKAMQAAGHDIGGHAATNTNHDRSGGFTALTAAELDVELRTNRAWLAENGFYGRDHFAYPQGLVNATVEDGVRKYFADARVIHRSPRETQNPGNIMRLRAYSANDPATLANLTAAVDAAYTNKSWLIIIVHDVVTTPTGGSIPQWSTANFNSLIDYLNTKGIPVRTVADVLNTAS